MTYAKEDAIRRVISCAETYRDELSNRNLLFVCMDKHKRLSYLEVTFHDYSFMHLTGLIPQSYSMGENEEIDERISAVDFYERCISHKLSPHDFNFSDKGTTPMKLDILPFIVSKNLMASMAADFNSSRPKLYTEKLAGGTKACIGFVKDQKSNEYIPNTALKEDIRNIIVDCFRVIITYRKYIVEKNYSEIVYAAKKIAWDKVVFPDKLSYLPKPV